MILKRASIVLVVAFLLFSIMAVLPIVNAEQQDAATAISSAQSTLLNCYSAAKSAEAAGANITQLTSTLNQAGALLSRAQLALSQNDSVTATNLAVQSQGLLGGFVSQAGVEQSSAQSQKDESFFVNVVLSTVGTVVAIAASFGLWYLLKRMYNGNSVKKSALQRYKVLFFVIAGIIILLVASPALQRVLVYPQTDFFTETWLLGPSHTAENYPYNITADQNYGVFLGIANHLGSCAYYMVEVKFRNETQSAPDTLGATASSLPSLYNMYVFVPDGGQYEVPLNFAFGYSISNVTRVVYSNVTSAQGFGNSSMVQPIPTTVTLLQANYYSLNLNNNTLSLRGLSQDWNSTTSEFYGNLFFELWIYNGTTAGFQYNNRFVSLQFNMTAIGMGGLVGG